MSVVGVSGVLLVLAAVLLDHARAAGMSVPGVHGASAAAQAGCARMLQLVASDLLGSEDGLLEAGNDGRECLQLARLAH